MIKSFRTLIVSLFILGITAIVSQNVEGVAAIYGWDRLLPGNWTVISMWIEHLANSYWFIWLLGVVTTPALFLLAGPTIRRLLGVAEMERLVDREIRENALQFKGAAIFKLVPYDASPTNVYLHMTLKNISPAPLYVRIDHASCSLEGRTNDTASVAKEVIFIPAGDIVEVNIPVIENIPLREQMTGRLTVGCSFGYDRKHLRKKLIVDGDIEVAVRIDGAGTFHQSFALRPRI